MSIKKYERIKNKNCNYPESRSDTGFTLVELMIVIAIVGILASVAMPIYKHFRMKAKASAVATDLRNFKTAFLGYSFLNEDYPPDSHETLPDGMESFINPTHFTSTTPLGGHYNWEGPDSYPYAGISILEPTASEEAIELLDKLIDDGNSATGKFRITDNGRATYIIEE